MVVFLLCMVLIVGVLLEDFSSRYNDQTRKAAIYISQGMEEAGMDYLRDLPLQNDQRITLIAQDGTVLFDNTTDPAVMENHREREEVQEAFAEGTGESTRYSDTLSKKTYYYAVLLSNGDVVRVATTQNAAWTLMFATLQPILIVVLVAMILSGVMASGIAKKIIRPINSIDLDHPRTGECYDELKPFLERIEAQNKQIKKQMHQIEIEHERRENLRKEFTANVSHELKTPLTSISGFAEIIKNGIAKPEDVKRFAGNIYDEAQRLSNMVGDIIKLSQLDEGGGAMQREPIDLYEVACSVKSALASVAQKMHVDVCVKGEHVVIDAVSQVVDEIVYNLCENAIKYNIEGGSVVMCVQEDALSVRFIVQDTGIGIAPDEIERVAERFYRVNKSHSKEVAGTGLGLSIVKHGAAFLGAQMQIESEVGKGTKVSILFEKELV